MAVVRVNFLPRWIC